MNKYAKLTNWKTQEKEWLKSPTFRELAKEQEPAYELARAIIAKRLQKKMTQVELAKKAKTSQSAIARVESGQHKVSLSFLQKLADALNFRLEIRLLPK